MQDSRIVVSGGRTLAYTDIGDRSGPCLFFFHGAPMSRLHLVPLEGQFAALGLRVIAPDRPGYGGSSPQPGRSMADWLTRLASIAFSSPGTRPEVLTRWRAWRSSPVASRRAP